VGKRGKRTQGTPSRNSTKVLKEIVKKWVITVTFKN